MTSIKSIIIEIIPIVKYLIEVGINFKIWQVAGRSDKENAELRTKVAQLSKLLEERTQKTLEYANQVLQIRRENSNYTPINAEEVNRLLSDLQHSADYLEGQYESFDSRTHQLILGMSFIDQKVDLILTFMGNTPIRDANQVYL